MNGPTDRRPRPTFDRPFERAPRRFDDFRPLEVAVFDGNVEKAMRILKREIGKEGVLKALKRKRYYEKPSEARKRKMRDAQRRLRRTARRTPGN